MGNTPFKLKGWTPFTKKSPAKDGPVATHPEHHETEKVDRDAFEKILLKQSEEGEKPLTKQEEKILGKYRSRKFKETAE